MVLDLTNMADQTIKLGGGLRQDCDAIAAMKAGTLKFSMPNKYWVETTQKRVSTIPHSEKFQSFLAHNTYFNLWLLVQYVPCVKDSVLGIVVDSKADVRALCLFLH